MNLSSKDIIRILEESGWSKVMSRGSHYQFRHPKKKGRLTVPHPRKEFTTGTIKAIRKRSGVKLSLKAAP